jgi:hypothetical protein
LSEIAGDISLGLNVIALIFVTIGIVRRKGSKKVMIRHGYLSIVGFAIKLATVFAVMIPSLLVSSSELGTFSALPLGLVVVKVVLGIAGDAMGFVCIVPWLLKPVEQMGCYRVKKWMLPTFIIWSISIILGAIIHLGGIM